MLLFFLFLHFNSSSSFLPVPHFHLYCLFYLLFSFFLGDNAKWPTRYDVSLNPNTINLPIFFFFFFFFFFVLAFLRRFLCCSSSMSVYSWFHMSYVGLFCHYIIKILFHIPSFCTLGSLCLVIVPFSGYLHL